MTNFRNPELMHVVWRVSAAIADTYYAELLIYDHTELLLVSIPSQTSIAMPTNQY